MKILIIGSINVDKVLYAHSFPNIGETVESLEALTFHGGKGANQAIAIKRLSEENKNDVYFFGKVGEDNFGKREIENLANNKINTNWITTTKKPTGEATIIISQVDKDNMIIVNKGANDCIDEKDWKSLEEAISLVDVVVMQLEINLEAIEKALFFAKKHNKKVIMNPAPAKKFRIKWLPYIEWLVPNETELELISNLAIKNINDIENSIKGLRSSGLNKIIVTLGDAGVYVDDKKYKFRLPAKKVEVVDTTAAGDTFIGGFISSSFEYKTLDQLKEIIKFAIVSAAITVQKKGAQSSIPTRKEVEKWKRQNY